MGKNKGMSVETHTWSDIQTHAIGQGILLLEDTKQLNFVLISHSSKIWRPVFFISVLAFSEEQCSWKVEWLNLTLILCRSQSLDGGAPEMLFNSVLRCCRVSVYTRHADVSGPIFCMLTVGSLQEEIPSWLNSPRLTFLPCSLLSDFTCAFLQSQNSLVINRTVVFWQHEVLFATRVGKLF